ncbi:MAG: hypothetical protein ACRC0H_12110, partial [Aeromonas sobria]
MHHTTKSGTGTARLAWSPVFIAEICGGKGFFLCEQSRLGMIDRLIWSVRGTTGQIDVFLSHFFIPRSRPMEVCCVQLDRSGHSGSVYSDLFL